jgi:hypothetical protein
MHPDGACEPALSWVSPQEGEISITGTVSDSAPEGGDGVVVRILQGDQELWSLTIDSNDASVYPISLQVPVAVGDAIYFRVNQRGSVDFDSTQLRVNINQGGLPCPSGDRQRCFTANLTYAVSTDGGRSFTQPPSPDNLIAAPPAPYTPDAGSFAMWQPSNIVLNPHDGYYYAMVARIHAPYEQGGHVNSACVMRTQSLDDPATWRAWDGEGFDLAMQDPYTTPGLDPVADACEVVEPLGLTYSLTYNSYLEAFMAVGHAYSPVAVRQNGFYFVLSKDLVHWSRPQLLMPAEFVNTTNGAYLAYPSLVDPDSPSLSFDVAGQDVYLFYSIFNDRLLANTDLMRVRVHFERQ